MPWILGAIGASVIFGLFSSNLAIHKGYFKGSSYFWTGFFFWLLGFLYVGFLPINSKAKVLDVKDTEEGEYTTTFENNPETQANQRPRRTNRQQQRPRPMETPNMYQQDRSDWPAPQDYPDRYKRPRRTNEDDN